MKNSYFDLHEQWGKEEEVLKNALISKVLTNRLVFIGKVTLKENFNMLIGFFSICFSYVEGKVDAEQTKRSFWNLGFFL